MVMNKTELRCDSVDVVLDSFHDKQDNLQKTQFVKLHIHQKEPKKM